MPYPSLDSRERLHWQIQSAWKEKKDETNQTYGEMPDPVRQTFDIRERDNHLFIGFRCERYEAPAMTPTMVPNSLYSIHFVVVRVFPWHPTSALETPTTLVKEFFGTISFLHVPSDPSLTRGNSLATGHGRKINLIRLPTASTTISHVVVVCC